MTNTKYTLITFILWTFIMGSEWIGFDASDRTRFDSKALSSNIESTDIQFRLSGYSMTEVETPWGIQYKIETEGGSSIMEAGSPDLDQVFASIVIPDNASMNAEVISSSYVDIENVDVAPSKGNFTRMINPSDVSFIQGDGLKIIWLDKWVHIRESNTEPIIRIIAEADTYKNAKKLINILKENIIF